MSAREQVMARARAALRISRLYVAESQGLTQAAENMPAVQYSLDHDEQQAFLRGHKEGQDIKHAYSPVAQTA